METSIKLNLYALRLMAQFGKCGRWIHSVKYRRPGHDPLHTRIYHIPNIFLGDSAIDLNGKLQSPFLLTPTQLTDFVERIGDKLLASKTGIDAHHQDKAGDIQDLIERGDGCGRI